MLTDVKSMTPVAGVLVLLLFGGAQHIRAQSQDDTWRSIGPDLPSSSAFYAATRQLMIDLQAL